MDALWTILTYPIWFSTLSSKVEYGVALWALGVATGILLSRILNDKRSTDIGDSR